MNTYLNENFDTSFNIVYNPFTEPLGKNIRYKIIDYGQTNFTADALEQSGGFYTSQQEFDNSGAMTSFSALIIRSNSLPIINEIISLQNRNGINVSGNSISSISDFEIDLGSNKNLRGYIHYLPTAEYRKITLNGNTPINRIDLEILWKDNYDNLYPVLIPAHQIATIKILFEEL